MNNIYLKNEITGEIKQVEKGFNWNVFLFSWIYLFIKGDIGSGITLLIVDSVAATFTVQLPGSVPFVCLFITIMHSIVAYDWYKYHIKLLEKKDFHIQTIES